MDEDLRPRVPTKEKTGLAELKRAEQLGFRTKGQAARYTNVRSVARRRHKLVVDVYAPLLSMNR